MYLIVDFHMSSLFVWSGKDCTPECRHGILVQAAQQAKTAEIDSAMQAYNHLFFSRPIGCKDARGKLVLLPMSLTKTIQCFLIFSNKICYFLKSKKRATFLFYTVSSRICWIFSATGLLFVAESSATRSKPPDSLRSVLRYDRNSFTRQFYASETITSLSQRIPVLQRTALFYPEGQETYGLFPLSDYFSSRLHFSAELPFGQVTVLNKYGTWELKKPSTYCQGLALYLFESSDRLFVFFQSDRLADGPQGDFFSWALLPQAHLHRKFCHHELGDQ